MPVDGGGSTKKNTWGTKRIQGQSQVWLLPKDVLADGQSGLVCNAMDQRTGSGSGPEDHTLKRHRDRNMPHDASFQDCVHV